MLIIIATLSLPLLVKKPMPKLMKSVSEVLYLFSYVFAMVDKPSSLCATNVSIYTLSIILSAIVLLYDNPTEILISSFIL